MNKQSLSKIQECLELAAEFVKDENSYNSGGCYGIMGCSSVGDDGRSSIVKKKSNDIRAKAELEASRLERQEKCANLIKECLEYVKTVNKFEN